MDERLDHLAAVAVITLRDESVLDCAAEGKSSDPLRRPVGGDFLAAHPPNFFGVALEKGVKEPFAELIAHPLFKIARISHRKEARFQRGKNAQSRSEDTQFEQRFKWPQRIGEKFSVVKNPRRPWPHEHVIRQNLRPQIFYRFGLREETVPADIEMETVVSNGSRNATDINRIGFENDDIHVFLRKKIPRRQTRWACSDNGDSCFHLLLRDPVAPGEIPDVPALYAQPSSAEKRYRRDAQCPYEHRRRTKLTQKIQKRQHDQNMHAKFIAEHAFHAHAGHAAD